MEKREQQQVPFPDISMRQAEKAIKKVCPASRRNKKGNDGVRLYSFESVQQLQRSFGGCTGEAVRPVS